MFEIKILWFVSMALGCWSLSTWYAGRFVVAASEIHAGPESEWF
jgi:hypothetical protein